MNVPLTPESRFLNLSPWQGFLNAFVIVTPNLQAIVVQRTSIASPRAAPSGSLLRPSATALSYTQYRLLFLASGLTNFAPEKTYDTFFPWCHFEYSILYLWTNCQVLVAQFITARQIIKTIPWLKRTSSVGCISIERISYIQLRVLEQACRELGTSQQPLKQ